MGNIFSKIKTDLNKSSNNKVIKNLLVDKPWSLVDNDGEIQKLIFKKDGGLILSKNGKVQEGKWEYFSEAKSLLIDRVIDKILLNELFVDSNALLFKKDGTQNEFFALANENTITDYNVPKYIHEVRKLELKMTSFKLLSGKEILIHNGQNATSIVSFLGNEVEEVTSDYNIGIVHDGKYYSDDLRSTLFVNGSKITNTYNNRIISTINGDDVVVEDAETDVANPISLNQYIGKRVTLNGKPIIDGRYFDETNRILEVKENHIVRIKYLTDYELSKNIKITIEQSRLQGIQSGDIVVNAEPVFPLPDGKYRIKGMWYKIKIHNNTIF